MAPLASSSALTPPGAGQPSRQRPAGKIPEAASRTGWICIGTIILVPAGLVVQRWMQPALFAAVMNDGNRLLALALVLSAIGVFALHRYKVVGPSTIVALGIAFHVVGAFVIAMIETALPIDPLQPVLGMSKVAAWILVFGLIVPNRPGWTLGAASAAAAMWPLAYAVNAGVFRFPPTTWRQFGVWPIINTVAALVVYLVSRRLADASLPSDPTRDLGSYRLVARLGAGGMGEVWKADHHMLARKAAIKLIRPQAEWGRQADLAVHRFRREADAIASLQSPHTVYLYDFGSAEDGRLYYAMELLDGISLQTLVTSFGAQPAARVIPMLIDICDSLEEAHRQGIVHRDLKPSNIMLCKVALSYDFVKVLDFGLAKLVRNTEATQWTRVGMATGTPGYIAPEVATGESAIDGRADIYSLGCVAYFLLTGSMVFEDPNPMKLALQHVRANPIPPSARATAPIPEALERIVLHCLAKAPGDRPPSAAAVATMLAECAEPLWTNDQAEAWWHRHLEASPLRTTAQAASGPPATIRKV